MLKCFTMNYTDDVGLAFFTHEISHVKTQQVTLMHKKRVRNSYVVLQIKKKVFAKAEECNALSLA